MMKPPESLDFANTWQTYASFNSGARQSDAGEIDFWAQHAVGYDAQFSRDPDSYRETLKTLCGLVRPSDTLLEVGAGSGRFALPLSQVVRAVTGLDISPDMLAILSRKCVEQGITNLSTIQSRWEDTLIEPHDVVLAAWSLYRQQDILSSLQKLIDSTKRTLIIVDGDYALRPDDDPPHERLRTAIWGAGAHGLCNYLYFAGMLRQLRVRADVRIVYEHATSIYADVLTLARAYAPQSATDEALTTYVQRLAPYIRQGSAGCIYTYRFAVGVVIWQRYQGEN